MWILHGVARAADMALIRLRLAELGAPFGPIERRARPQVVEIDAKPLPLAAIATRFWDAAALGEPGGLDQARAAALAFAHAQIQSHLVSEIDLLPAKLAGGVPRRADLIAPLRARADVYAADLARTAGAAEFALRISAVAPNAGARSSPEDDAAETDALEAGGRSYLRGLSEARLARAARREAVVAFCEEAARAAAALGREIAIAYGASERRPERRMEVAILLDRDRVEALAALGQALAPRAAALDLACVVIGPWAPFSFLSVEGDDGADGGGGEGCDAAPGAAA